LAAYQAVETQIWRTDRDGAIWAELDLTRQQLSMHSTREWILQPALTSADIWSVEQDNLRRLWRRWNWT